ncbi:MAG: hypothetical protein ABIN58_11870, partial [candidate division WOR-3 bacterium]
MPEQNNLNNKGGRSPPPPPVVRNLANVPLAFRISAAPPKPPIPPARTRQKPPSPPSAAPGAKTTLSIRIKLSDLGLRPAPPEQETSNDERFLRYGTALYRARELVKKERWDSLNADEGDMKKGIRESIDESVKLLEERKGESEDLFSQYKMLKAFARMIGSDDNLYDYLFWVQEKEQHFSQFAEAYWLLGMSPLSPYEEVLSACRERLAKGASPIISEFYKTIGDQAESGGMQTIGELNKRMFDSWYVVMAADAVANMKKAAQPIPPQGAIPDAVIGEVREMRKREAELESENERLKANLANEKEAVSALSGKVGALNEEHLALQDAFKATRGENSRLMEELAKVREENESHLKKASLLEERIKEMEEGLREMKREIEELREENRRIREAYEKVVERNSLLAQRNAYLEEREKALSERFVASIREAAPEIGERETVVSGVQPTTAIGRLAEHSTLADMAKPASAVKSKEAGKLLKGIEKEIGQILEEGGAVEEGKFVVEPAGFGRARPEAALMAKAEEGPEITQPIDIEKEGREIVAAEPVGFWRTRPGRAIHAIFAYGLCGKEPLMQKPIRREIPIPDIGDAEAHAKALDEFERERQRYELEMEEYGAWYNKAGRWISARREGAVNAAHAFSAFWAGKKRQLKIAAAGAVGVVAIASVAVVGVHMGTFLKSRARHLEARPAVAQVEKGGKMPAPLPEKALSGEGEANEIERPELPPYDLNAEIEAALLRNGIAKEMHPKEIYKRGIAIENDAERFAVVSYAAEKILSDNEVRRKMSEKVVTAILAGAMEEAVKFASAQPAGSLARAQALGAASRASGGIRFDVGAREAPSEYLKKRIPAIREKMAALVAEKPADAGVGETA